MWKFKKAMLIGVLGGITMAQVQASESLLPRANNRPSVDFNQTEMDAMFDVSDKPLQLANLSDREMKETEGAWVWWAVGGAVGGIMNTGGYIGGNADWTYGKAAYSFLSGAAGGIIGALPGGSAMRVGYGALGAYTAMQPWGGYSWSRW